MHLHDLCTYIFFGLNGYVIRYTGCEVDTNEISILNVKNHKIASYKAVLDNMRFVQCD